jgi:hypothetical protein
MVYTCNILDDCKFQATLAYIERHYIQRKKSLLGDYRAVRRQTKINKIHVGGER